MPGLDLADIVNQAVSTSAGMSSDIARIGTINDAAQTVANQSIEDSRRAGDAASEMKRIELEEAARQKQSMNTLALKIGGNPDIAGSFILKAAEQTEQGFAQLADARARITEKKKVGFLDNPLVWLVNQATIKGDIADYNNAAGIINEADDMAQQMAGLQDIGNKQIVALGNTYSEAYITSAKTLAAHQYMKEASAAQLEGLRFNMAGITAAASMRKEQVGLLFSAQGALQQQKQIDIALDHLKIAQADFNIKAEAKARQTTAEEIQMGYVSQGFFNLTGSQMPDADKKVAITKLQMGDPRTKIWYDNGLQSSMLGNKPVIDVSPYRATNLIATNQVTKWASPAMREVGEQLVSWRKEFESNPALAGSIDPKDKEGREKAFNEFVRTKVGTNPEQYPIFQPMKLTEFTKINKNMAALPVYANVLGPASKTGVNIDDPQTAFSIITAAMAEGKLSYVDAADYSALVGGALNAKSQGNNLLAFGITPPKQFKSSIKLTQDFGRDSINVVDQNQFARALNKALAIRATTVDQGTLGRVAGATGSSISDAYMGTIGQVQGGGKPTYTPENQAEVERMRRARSGTGE